MAESFVQYPSDSSGKKSRTYEKATAGHDAYIIQTTNRVVGGLFGAGTWATNMVANAATQNLATFANAAGSAVLVAVRSLVVSFVRVTTTNYTNVSPIRLWPPGSTVPSGGTAMTKHKLDTNGAASASQVTFLGASSADNVASAITYALPATPLCSQVFTPTLTGAGQFATDPARLFHLLDDRDPPLVLRAGESCLITSQNHTNTTSVIFTVECIWEEFTLP